MKMVRRASIPGYTSTRESFVGTKTGVVIITPENDGNA